MVELKEEWVQVVHALTRDPTASLQEIADRTEVPKSTVWYAKERLEEDDLLQILTFLHVDELEDSKVGLIGGSINGDREDVLSDVAEHPNVWFLVDTIGPHAFTAGIVATTDPEFQSVIDDLRELGAHGDHYGEVTNIRELGVSTEFVHSLTDIETR